ncbi:DUF2254 domain-containing protein [Aestuariimicrobium ganziense]|uniref:DUF2254 domain-containing protein n=1 Tax=Aestuariimicrobium ganziense TaxID=2773677 RepID=UPI0019432A52|nr:DUF2254 domain-containing protein [Aestuariimicrobium ganziense]
MDTAELTAKELSPPARSWWIRLWTPFWAVPLAVVATSFVVALVLPLLDERLAAALPYVFQGGPDGARTVLSSIAGAMISVTGLVFSITMVVLQLASSQFTPRLLGSFLRNRVSQFTLGVFTASFVYSLTVLRSVRGSDEDPFVPQVSVSLAFFLVVASVALFLAFIHYITTSIQVSRVISRVGDATARTVDRLYLPEIPAAPPPEPRLGPPSGVVSCAERHGRVAAVNYARLVEVAAEQDGVVELLVRHGDQRTEGQPLARLFGMDSEVADKMEEAVILETERVLDFDPGYGFQQLVDIATRALSPGINDPTTAVQSLDELQRLLRPLLRRPEPSPYLRDDEDRVRVVWRPQRIADLLDLSFTEIVHYGAGAPQVNARLVEILTDLKRVARPEHIDCLDRHLAAVHAGRRA